MACVAILLTFPGSDDPTTVAEAGLPAGGPDCRTVYTQISSEGAVRGVVRDAGGRSAARGHRHRDEPGQFPARYISVSESDGRYRLLNLPPGVFDVVAELAGFTKYHAAGRRSPGRARPHPRYRAHARKRGRERCREGRVATTRNASRFRPSISPAISCASCRCRPDAT